MPETPPTVKISVEQTREIAESMMLIREQALAEIVAEHGEDVRTSTCLHANKLLDDILRSLLEGLA